MPGTDMDYPNVRMNTTKPKWESKTLQGIAVVIIALVARLAGYSLDDASAKEFVDVATEILTLLAALYAWWGRVTATKVLR